MLAERSSHSGKEKKGKPKAEKKAEVQEGKEKKGKPKAKKKAKKTRAKKNPGPKPWSAGIVPPASVSDNFVPKDQC